MPLWLTPNDPMGEGGRRNGTAPLPTTSCELRSQPERDILPFAEIPAQNSPAVSIVQAVVRFSFHASRYQWLFNHLVLWTGSECVSCANTRRAQHPMLPITSPRTIRGLCIDPRRGNLFPPSCGFVAELPTVRAEPQSATPELLAGGRSLGRKVECRRFR